MTVDGFWLPKDIRGNFVSTTAEFSSQSYLFGRSCDPEDGGAVTAVWPRLDLVGWQALLAQLKNNRNRVPTGSEFWNRFQAALQAFDNQLLGTPDPQWIERLRTIPVYTGFSEPMIRMTFSALRMMSFTEFSTLFAISQKLVSAPGWQSLPGMQGKFHFYPRREVVRSLVRFSGKQVKPIYQSHLMPEMVVGFGAGNVPGTALLISMLCLASTLSGEKPPAVLVRNSRQEPIFTPVVLDAIERFDPDLLCSTAILVWDYEDAEVQKLLLSQADLVIAAASDETIDRLQAQVEGFNRKHPTRFHSHGHKVSFTAVGREILAPGYVDPATNLEVLEIVTLLAALDSIYWDQFGCLSARVHFVDMTGLGPDCVHDYARRLENQLRLLSGFLPRGSWPKQAIHERFDRYKQLEKSGKISVYSSYDDDFLLVLDERVVDRETFLRQVNECQGRIIVIRPVEGLDQIHRLYLSWIPNLQLQSLSVAIGSPGKGLDSQFLRFATACGERGVTAIRTVGRAAFPQLAYSWDGLLPLDVVYARPDGYFTTIEFDQPYDQIIQTYEMLIHPGLSLNASDLEELS